jgi:hypothetical protein
MTSNDRSEGAESLAATCSGRSQSAVLSCLQGLRVHVGQQLDRGKIPLLGGKVE